MLFLLLRAKSDFNKEIDFRNLPDTKKKKYRYKLPEVYSIWILDYPVQFMENVYRDEVGLYNMSSVSKEGCIPISSKNKYIIVDLTKFNKPKDKLGNDEDRWLYILKNAGSSSSLPEFDNPTFEDALRRIECDSANDELLIRQANMKDFLYAYSDAIDESFEKGVEKQRIEGEKKRDNAIKALLAQKVAEDVIAKAFGISVEEVLSIKEELS